MKTCALHIAGAYLFLLLVFPASACSSVHVTVDPESKSKDANVTVIGRTMEQGYRLLLPAWDIFVVPRQSPKFLDFFVNLAGKKGSTPSSTNCSPYNPKTKGNSAGFVVITAPVSSLVATKSPFDFVLEGQNEFGLTISAQTFQTTLYQKIDSANGDCDGKEELAWLDFIPYLLGTFTTAEDAVSALREKVVVTRPDQVRAVGIHWTIDDAQGGHYVVEYLNNQLVTHRSRIGVFTNDPSFSWHVENLNIYGNLQAEIATPSFAAVELPSGVYPEPYEKVVPAPFSHGSGQLGIPGDGTPASRFVRLFYLRGLSQANAPPAYLTDALALVTNLLDVVTIPYGSSNPKESDETRAEAEESKKTGVHSLENLFSSVSLQQWCVLKVPSRGLFYYRDYVNSAWKVIDFETHDFTEGAPVKSIKVHDLNEAFAQAAPLVTESK